jgi:hypothetical protein
MRPPWYQPLKIHYAHGHRTACGQPLGFKIHSADVFTTYWDNSTYNPEDVTCGKCARTRAFSRQESNIYEDFIANKP